MSAIGLSLIMHAFALSSKGRRGMIFGVQSSNLKTLPPFLLRLAGSIYKVTSLMLDRVCMYSSAVVLCVDRGVGKGKIVLRYSTQLLIHFYIVCTSECFA